MNLSGTLSLSESSKQSLFIPLVLDARDKPYLVQFPADAAEPLYERFLQMVGRNAAAASHADDKRPRGLGTGRYDEVPAADKSDLLGESVGPPSWPDRALMA